MYLRDSWRFGFSLRRRRLSHLSRFLGMPLLGLHAREKFWRNGLCRVLLASLILGALGLSPVRAGGEEPVTAGEILQRVDENRIIRPEFAFEMEITSYKDGGVIDQYTLAGYVRIREANVQTLLYFLAPPKVNGQKMLMSGKEIWMHFPKTKNVIKLSPAQILLGEVANGDIMQLNFSRDYHCTLLPEGDSPDTAAQWARDNGDKGTEFLSCCGDKGTELLSCCEDHRTCARLLLAARENGEGTYQKIILYVDKESYLPVAGEFYARSGKLLKTVAYREYRQVLGKPVAMKVTIYDGLQTEKYTVMEYKRLVEKSVPVNYYRKEYLPRFTYFPLD
ncbi:MAG TPA: outer membrane lipoprotein-sorting protein [Firmicutes bacterium]|nr:outer membrane lipoprotein-sorting protein [Bacillota bacterium]